MKNEIIQASQLRTGMVFRRISGFLPRIVLSVDWDDYDEVDITYMRRDGSITQWTYAPDYPLVVYGEDNGDR